jgi:flagellin
MSSLLTNTSAMAALQALSMTQQSLATTENQISTGKAISTASDNSAYWSIATKMTSTTGALSSVSEALSQNISVTKLMSQGLTSSISVMDAIKNDLVTAQTTTTPADLKKVQTDIASQLQSLVSIGNSSVFNGQNYLAGTTAGDTGTSVSLVASYDTNNGVSYLTFNTQNTVLFGGGLTSGAYTVGVGSTLGILGSTIAVAAALTGATYTQGSVLGLSVTAAGLTAGDFNAMINVVDQALSSITNGEAEIGATTVNLTTQQAFVSNLNDALTTGIGSLVDANMNQASTKLAALQVQQQLGIQSLSIANSNTQTILKLFGA